MVPDPSAHRCLSASCGGRLCPGASAREGPLVRPPLRLGVVGPCWHLALKRVIQKCRANSGFGTGTPGLPLLSSDVKAAVLFFQKLFG